METIIKVKPSELNMELLQKIKDFIGNKKNIDITISLNDSTLNTVMHSIIPSGKPSTKQT